jgi:two-component system response regulator HydG
LFYRLNVVHIRMPSLREHLDDVPLLAAHFLGLLRRKLNIEKLEISSEALKLLQSHSWPGNVRELANAMERATALRRGFTLETSDFALGAESAPKALVSSEKLLVIELGTPLEAVEDRMIRAALSACGGDKEKAAAMLGISARTIYRKLGEG